MDNRRITNRASRRPFGNDTGGPGNYSLSVTVQSPDAGCDNYADWWEVLSAESGLLFRRVLLHSHTEEQPFTRSGGPVNIRPDDEIIIRAHMNTSGYGGQSLSGTISGGLVPIWIIGVLPQVSMA